MGLLNTHWAKVTKGDHFMNTLIRSMKKPTSSVIQILGSQITSLALQITTFVKVTALVLGVE